MQNELKFRVLNGEEVGAMNIIEGQMPFGDAIISDVFIGSHSWFILFEGDLFVPGKDRDQPKFREALENKFEDIKPKSCTTLISNIAIIVMGNLHVEGLVSAPLYVSGNLKCEFLENTNEELIWVRGDADVEFAINGYYNGTTGVEGFTKTPFILAESAHVFDCGGKIVIANGYESELVACDITTDMYEDYLHPDFFFGEDEDEYELDVYAFWRPVVAPMIKELDF